MRTILVLSLLALVGCKTAEGSGGATPQCAGQEKLGKWSSPAGAGYYGIDKETWYFAENCTGYFKAERTSPSLDCDVLFTYSESTKTVLAVPDNSCSPWLYPFDAVQIVVTAGTDGGGQYISIGSIKYYRAP